MNYSAESDVSVNTCLNPNLIADHTLKETGYEPVSEYEMFSRGWQCSPKEAPASRFLSATDYYESFQRSTRADSLSEHVDLRELSQAQNLF